MKLERTLMARAWGVEPRDVHTHTRLTHWVERQIRYIESRFDLDLPEIDVCQAPSGKRPDGGRRIMAVGGAPWAEGLTLFVSEDASVEYSPTALHYVVRHEIAHIIDRQERGTSDEDSPEFRAVAEMLGAPLSGRATETRGKENAERAAENAPQAVHEFASKGL